MFDISNDRIIITMKGGEKRTIEKAEIKEIIVKSHSKSDLFSIEIKKKTFGQVRLYLATELIDIGKDSDNVLILFCD